MSLAKEEIEAYWKLKKKIEEEHLRAISTPSYTSTTKGGTHELLQDDGTKLQRSYSVPPAKFKPRFMDRETEASMEQLIKKNGWWTRSNWAFLNEPPVLDRPANTYVSQFNIANLSNSKSDPGVTT